MKTTLPRALVGSIVVIAALLSAQYVAALDSGSKAPNISAKTMDGKTFKLSKLRGKVVVVDFWASWCEPCKQAMPALDKIYKKYKSKGVVVVGVSVDRDAAKAKGFLKNHSVSYPVMHDSGHSVAEKYSPPRMPSIFVIDKRGVVRDVHAGYHSGDAAKLEKQIRKLL